MMVPVCSSGTLTNVLPHRNAMPQTCIHKQYIDTGRPVSVLSIGVERHTGIPILMYWVRPDREILTLPSTHTSERSTLCWYGGSQSEARCITYMAYL